MTYFRMSREVVEGAQWLVGSSLNYVEIFLISLYNRLGRYKNFHYDSDMIRYDAELIVLKSVFLISIHSHLNG
jgi:hypothetical protein